MTETRTETDSFGPVEVPADCLWGAQTQRSIENFPFGPQEHEEAENDHPIAVAEDGSNVVSVDFSRKK